jgi:hypothetical protein
MRILACAVGMAASIKRDACKPVKGGVEFGKTGKTAPLLSLASFACFLSSSSFLWIFLSRPPWPTHLNPLRAPELDRGKARLLSSDGI